MTEGFWFGIGFFGAALVIVIFVVIVSAITNAIVSVLDRGKEE